jgi:hypothetical protein
VSSVLLRWGKSLIAIASYRASRNQLICRNLASACGFARIADRTTFRRTDVSGMWRVPATSSISQALSARHLQKRAVLGKTPYLKQIVRNMRRELLGRAYAWRASGQWFHAASSEFAPSDALVVERYLICGQIVLRLFPEQGGGIVRGAQPHAEPN